MMRLAVVAMMVLVGCGPSDRDRDCAEVRAIIAADPAGHHFGALRKLRYRDAKVREAVMVVISDPEDTAPRLLGSNPTADDFTTPRDRLRDLCALTSRPLP